MIKFEALMAVFRKRDFLAVSYPLMLSVMLAVSIYCVTSPLQCYRFETIGSSITKSLKKSFIVAIVYPKYKRRQYFRLKIQYLGKERIFDNI